MASSSVYASLSCLHVVSAPYGHIVEDSLMRRIVGSSLIESHSTHRASPYVYDQEDIEDIDSRL
jgi:hypothetical protein